MNTKTTLPLLLCALILTACSEVKVIGKMNMVSNRNIDYSSKYKMISSYAGGSDREMKKSRSKSIQDAVDQTVKSIPGGEYLMNVTIYMITKGSNNYFACQGDVWGPDNAEISFRGFKKGDKVQFKNPAHNIISSKKEKTHLEGKIISLVSDKVCMVEDEKNVRREISYDDLTKIQ